MAILSAFKPGWKFWDFVDTLNYILSSLVEGINDAWVNFATAEGAQTGTFTVVYKGLRYKKIGKTIHIAGHIIPVFKGSAAGYATLTLPFTATSTNAIDGSPNYWELSGYDDQNKLPLRVYVPQGSTTVRISRMDGTTAIYENARLYFSGTYEAA